MFVPLQESVPVVAPSAAGGVFSLLWVIIALPALGAAVILLLGNTRTSKWAHLLGCATVVVSFLISLVAFVVLLGRDAGSRQIDQNLWSWVQAGSFKVDMVRSWPTAVLDCPLIGLVMLGAFSSGFFLYGIALTYGYAGSMKIGRAHV